MEPSNQYECVKINLRTMLPLGLAWNETCEVDLLVRVVVVVVMVVVINTVDLQATPFTVNVI